MTNTGVERIANRARQEPQTRYTSLMHHFSVDNLRACFESLDGKKAIGVDGVTKAMYGQNLEANLQDLYGRLHRMSYRPQPVRRVEIPKDDGSTRPLGISCLEDKIVQEMARRVLERGLSRIRAKTGHSESSQTTLVAQGSRPWEAFQRLILEVHCFEGHTAPVAHSMNPILPLF